MLELHTMLLPTSVGVLKLVASDAGLCAVLWPQDATAQRVILPRAVENAAHPILCAAARQLDEYFAGTRRQFDVPLDLAGTPFQLKAWAALCAIPFGQTRTYTEQAHSMAMPNAVRAVGAANGRNPLSIIVPCHRVVGADGQLTGYAGGLEAKKWLLDFEREDGKAGRR